MLHRHTELFRGMGIGGDDADELFDLLHKEYGTSFKGLNLADYFPDEAVMWQRGFLPRFLRADERCFELLNFGHLVDVVAAGAWFAP